MAETLQELLEDLSRDFALEVVGFEMPDIDRLISQLSISEQDADEVPPLSADAVSWPGDLWLLNDHRIVWGNSLHPAAYELLMNGNTAAMVFTDPPYNVPINGHVSGLGAIQHREFAMASGEMTPAEFENFLADVLTLAVQYSTEGAVSDVCWTWRHMEELLAAGRRAPLTLLNLCVWAKDNGGMGSLYRSQHELVFIFRNFWTRIGKLKPLRQTTLLSNIQLSLPKNETNECKRGHGGLQKSAETHPLQKGCVRKSDGPTQGNDIRYFNGNSKSRTKLCCRQHHQEALGARVVVYAANRQGAQRKRQSCQKAASALCLRTDEENSASAQGHMPDRT